MTMVIIRNPLINALPTDLAYQLLYHWYIIPFWFYPASHSAHHTTLIQHYPFIRIHTPSIHPPISKAIHIRHQINIHTRLYTLIAPHPRITLRQLISTRSSQSSKLLCQFNWQKKYRNKRKETATRHAHHHHQSLDCSSIPCLNPSRFGIL